MMLTEETASRLRRAVGSALPWVLLVAVLSNIAMTVAFYRGGSHAIQVSETGELADLVDSTYREMRQEYGVYAELARVARGSTLAVPESHPFDPDRMEFIAGVTMTEGAWYPGEAAEGLSPVVTDLMWVEDHTITYSIVVGDPGEAYGAVRSYGLVLLAPVRVLEGHTE